MSQASKTETLDFCQAQKLGLDLGHVAPLQQPPLTNCFVIQITADRSNSIGYEHRSLDPGPEQDGDYMQICAHYQSTVYMCLRTCGYANYGRCRMVSALAGIWYGTYL